MNVGSLVLKEVPMPYIANLPRDAKVHHVLTHFNTGMERPLLNLQQAIMRSPDSPLTFAQRELIAAYVSGLNACPYCRGAHTACAVEFGVDAGIVEQLLDNIDTAPIAAKLNPLFKYARKLTLHQDQIEQKDVDAVFAEGWSDRALYDLMNVVSVFNFMNRFTLGLGLAPVQADFQREGRQLKRGGYGVANLLKLK